MDGFLFYSRGVLHLCIRSITYSQAVLLFPFPLECEGACSRVSHFPEKKRVPDCRLCIQHFSTSFMNHPIQTWVF